MTTSIKAKLIIIDKRISISEQTFDRNAPVNIRNRRTDFFGIGFRVDVLWESSYRI